MYFPLNSGVPRSDKQKKKRLVSILRENIVALVTLVVALDLSNARCKLSRSEWLEEMQKAEDERLDS